MKSSIVTLFTLISIFGCSKAARIDGPILRSQTNPQTAKKISGKDCELVTVDEIKKNVFITQEIIGEKIKLSFRNFSSGNMLGLGLVQVGPYILFDITLEKVNLHYEGVAVMLYDSKIGPLHPDGDIVATNEKFIVGKNLEGEIKMNYLLKVPNETNMKSTAFEPIMTISNCVDVEVSDFKLPK